MDGKKLSKGLTDGGDVIIKLVGLFAILFISVMIYLLFMGTVNYAVQNNNLPVSATVVTEINETEADFIAAKDTVTANTAIIAGLVALVVILAVLGWIIFRKGKSSGSQADF